MLFEKSKEAVIFKRPLRRRSSKNLLINVKKILTEQFHSIIMIITQR